MNASRSVVLSIFVLALVASVSLAASPTSIHLDLAKAEDAALIELAWENWPVSIQNDPFGRPALFFPKGTPEMAPTNTYDQMRFAVLNVPNVREFEMSAESIGIGSLSSTAGANGGNRAIAMVFGYEDMQNWWVAYFTYTNSTRVARIVDGKQEYICRPLVTLQWYANNDEYQTAKVSLKQEGDNMVLRAHVNGQPTSIDLCSFPASSYKGGKVGLGGHSTSNVQSWYLRNIKLDVF